MSRLVSTIIALVKQREKNHTRAVLQRITLFNKQEAIQPANDLEQSFNHMYAKTCGE